MRRLLLAPVLAALLVPTTALTQASAGGGCHRVEGAPGDLDRRTSVVSVEGACFTPTVTRVAVGQRVDLRNTSGIDHNVYGVPEIGLNDFPAGNKLAVTFTKAGVYPFACTLHPGMVGAIVVEAGVARSPAVQLARDVNAPAATLAPAAATTAPSAETSVTSAVGTTTLNDTGAGRPVATTTAVGVGAGALLGAAGVLVLRRRRRPTA